MVQEVRKWVAVNVVTGTDLVISWLVEKLKKTGRSRIYTWLAWRTIRSAQLDEKYPVHATPVVTHATRTYIQPTWQAWTLLRASSKFSNSIRACLRRGIIVTYLAMCRAKRATIINIHALTSLSHGYRRQ